MGLYFLEMGYGNWPAEATYFNRLASYFGESKAADYTMGEVVLSADMIYIFGITLMLSEGTREAAFQLAETAHRLRRKVCFDFNYRTSLNKKIIKNG